MTTRRTMSSMALVSALASVAGLAGIEAMPTIEPPERTKRPREVVEKYKSAAQKKRERKNARRAASRNGAKP